MLRRKLEGNKAKRYYEKNKDKLNLKHRTRYAAEKSTGKYRSQNTKYRQFVKYETLKRYSDADEPKCVECGFSDIRALCLDHLKDNGKEERKIHRSGILFYQYLKRNNYPDGYQTLCANCNLIKEVERSRNSANGTLHTNRGGAFSYS